jgi:hypothetical protein
VLAVNPVRLFLSLILVAVFVAPARAQKEDWQPITQHDLEMKQVPGNPGADAVQLYYADFINDQEQTEFFYHRIKVLNEKGKSHADVELIIPPEGFNLQPEGAHYSARRQDYGVYRQTVSKNRDQDSGCKGFGQGIHHARGQCGQHY